VLTRDGRLDAMTVKVERRHGIEPSAAQSAGRELATLVKNTIGVTVTIDVIDPDGVERSMGKMRRIIDQRPKT
jgi:phenylacetate-CoA ligase